MRSGEFTPTPSSTFSSSGLFTVSDTFTRPFDPKLEVFVSTLFTMSMTLTVTVSLEISFDAEGSQVIVVHTFDTVMDFPKYTVVRSSLLSRIFTTLKVPEDTPMSTGAVVGLAVGATAAVVMLAGIAVYIMRSQRKDRAQRSGEGSETGGSRIRITMGLTGAEGELESVEGVTGLESVGLRYASQAGVRQSVTAIDPQLNGDMWL
jgi:hypothetical protein